MRQTQDSVINGVLLLYHLHVVAPNAQTIYDHIDAFGRHSKFRVIKVNTELGFPLALKGLRFRVIVLHYSLFGMWPPRLNDRYCRYIEDDKSSYKIAFFQDEYWNCQERFAFINRYGIDCIYTRLRQASFKNVYEKYTGVSKIIHTLAGYVSDAQVEAAQKHAKRDKDRRIDIGYRSRKLPYFIGKAGQEKQQIAEGFIQRAAGLNLKLDISVDEQQRIYGTAWYQFLANCRGCLGVEGGSSVFDIEGVIQKQYKQLVSSNPAVKFQEMHEKVLQPWEDRIPYRSFTPRHFEAAAFRVCQILFKGDYSGMMEPMVHYIPLEKDFSNFDEVIRMFADTKLRHKLTEQAHDDLIASGRYTYSEFINSFDNELLESVFEPDLSAGQANRIRILLNTEQTIGKIRLRSRHLALGYYFPGRDISFPGRRHVKRILRAIFDRVAAV